MDSDQLMSWLNSRLDKITHREFNGCVKVSKVDITPFTDEVIVLVSNILKATVTLEMKDGTTKQLNTVAKLEPAVQFFDDMVNDLGLADAEAMIYQKVLPEMEKMMTSAGNADEIFWAECYLCDEGKFLLEDLNLSGYKLIPVKNLLGVNEAKLALKAIAKYHGMSLIMKERGMLDTNQVPINYLAKNLTFMNNLFTTSISQLASHIEKNWDPEWKNVADRLRKFVENVGEKLKALVTSIDGKCNVLSHGDFTMRNMLFHFNQNEEAADKVKLIDFQATNWSNQGIDIVSFLCSSILPQIRESNLDELLETYSQTLAETCKKFSYKGYVPTSSDVHKTYNALNYLVALWTLFVIPMSAIDPRDSKIAKLFEDCHPSETIDNGASQILSYDHKHIEDAIKFELERCLKLNIL